MALRFTLPLAALLLAPGALAQTATPGPPVTPPASSSSEPPAVQVTADENGFQIKSADNAFALRLRGDAQADGRFFVDDPDELGVDQLFLRRARVNLQGTLASKYDFRVMTNFGQGRVELQDAYLDACFSPAFAVEAGKFKVPLGLEWLRSATDLTLIEFGLATALVPRRDVGLMLHGAFASGKVGYELGLFNGALDNQNTDGDVTDGKDFAGRLFFQPFRGSESFLRSLGFGFAATVGEESGAFAAPAVPSYRTAGGRAIARFRTGTADSTTVLADGQRLRYAPQAYFFAGPAALMAELVVSQQEVRLSDQTAEIAATAWQVTAGYFLTGESASYGRVRPAHPLGRDGGLGAFEVAARYGVLQMDEDAFPMFANPASSAQQARAITVGLNWYPTASVKVMANYERTSFDLSDAAPDGTEALPSENLILTRFQIAF
jgi:phosphate-selective porin OprO/OprP